MSEGEGLAQAAVGVRIATLRDHAGWSQPELAARAGLSKATVSKLERGKTRQPDLATLRKLAAALRWPDVTAMLASTDLDPPVAPERPPDGWTPERIQEFEAMIRDVRELLLQDRADRAALRSDSAALRRLAESLFTGKSAGATG